MKPWDIYWATIQYEDSDQSKKRPVLLTTNGEAYQLGFKMTTKARDHELEYSLKDYSGAGLKKPTIVRLTHKVIPSAPLQESDFIGRVQKEDRKNILRLCKKYSIDVDDLK